MRCCIERPAKSKGRATSGKYSLCGRRIEPLELAWVSAAHARQSPHRLAIRGRRSGVCTACRKAAKQGHGLKKSKRTVRKADLREPKLSPPGPQEGQVAHRDLLVPAVQRLPCEGPGKTLEALTDSIDFRMDLLRAVAMHPVVWELDNAVTFLTPNLGLMRDVLEEELTHPNLPDQ
jgi:hypothetical protein